MRKFWGALLCLSLTVGTLTSAVPAYAMEEGQVIEAAAESSEGLDDSSFPGEDESGAYEDDQGKETASDAESGEAEGENDNNSEEALGEASGDEGKETAEDASGEGSGAGAGEASEDIAVPEDEQENAGEASEEISAGEAGSLDSEDSLEDDAEEDESTETEDELSEEEAADEASLEDSEELLEVEEDEELVGETEKHEIKTFKSDVSKVLKLKYNDKKTVKLVADAAAEGAKVKWTVSDTNVASFYSGGTSVFALSKDGKSCVTENIIQYKKPGKVTVTVKIQESNFTGNTSLEFTVFADGVNYSSGTGYKDGEQIRGWVNVDKNTHDILSVGKIDLKAASTAYFDPESGAIAENGFYHIGGRMYSFSNKRLDKDSTRNGNCQKDHIDPETYAMDYYCIDKTGEVKTGWRKITATGKEYYFDPETGFKVTESWVPKGGSNVYLDYNGELYEGFYSPEDGIKYILSKGVIQTGFIYVNADRKKVAANKAKYLMYCDPYAKVKGNIAEGHFTLKGKDYYTGGSKLDEANNKTTIPVGCIPMNTAFWCGNEILIADKTGAIIKDKIVTLGSNKYYVDENGIALRDTYMVIGGKYYKFDANGCMTIVGADGVGVVTGLYYRANGEYKTAYGRTANLKKADSGIAFYTDEKCTRKLTNCFLYAENDSGFPDPAPMSYLDKNGNYTIGIARIGSETYYFNSYGWVEQGKDAVEYKGKYYLLADNNKPGLVLTGQTGFRYVASSGDKSGKTGRWYYIKNASGELAKGKTVIEGKTYYFNDNTVDSNRGSLCYGSTKRNTSGGYIGEPLGSHWILTGNNMYYCNYDKQPETLEDAKKCYLLTGKLQHVVTDGVMYVVNKDGSAYNGIYSYDGKKCMVSAGQIGAGEEELEEELIVHTGKTYLLGKDGYFKGGWQKIAAGTSITNINNYSFTKVASNGYYYFDPANFAAVSGWKTVPVPTIDGSGNIKGQGSASKLYFNEISTDSMDKFALVRDCDMTIKGKTYHFGKDGTVQNEAINKSGKVDNSYYSPRTHELEKNVLRKVGNKWFFFGADGAVSTAGFTGTTYAGSVPVTATYNNDGSIKKFDVKNAIIISGGKYYAVGSNGLPVTGLYNLKGEEAAKLNGIKLFIESDGYCEGLASDTVSMRKINGKYYVLKGAVVQPGNSMYRIFDISKLSVDERNDIYRYYSWAGDAAAGFQVFTFGDGTLKAGTIKAGTLNGLKGDLHTNKYGMAYEGISPFIKRSGSWYYPYANPADKNCSMVVRMESFIGDGPDTYANICWDKSCKITSINYAVKDGSKEYDTGVPVTGVYVLYLPTGTVIVNINKGKFVTGNKKLSIEGITTTVNFEPNMGIALTQ